MSRPFDIKRFKLFLGAFDYFQRYIPKYADLTLLLTEFLKLKLKFVRDSIRENAFAGLKNVSASHPILTIADYSNTFRAIRLMLQM